MINVEENDPCKILQKEFDKVINQIVEKENEILNIRKSLGMGKPLKELQPMEESEITILKKCPPRVVEL